MHVRSACPFYRVNITAVPRAQCRNPSTHCAASFPTGAVHEGRCRSPSPAPRPLRILTSRGSDHASPPPFRRHRPVPAAEKLPARRSLEERRRPLGPQDGGAGRSLWRRRPGGRRSATAAWRPDGGRVLVPAGDDAGGRAEGYGASGRAA